MILKAFYNNIIIQERQNLFYHLISIFLETINPNFNIITTKNKIERLKNEIFKPKLTLKNNEEYIDNNLNIDNVENNISNLEEGYPFRIIGDLQKKGDIFGFFNYRYAEINVLKGLFKRYENPKKYPNNPIEVIKIEDFISLRMLPKKTGDKNHYFEIIYKSDNGKEKKEIYRTKHVSTRDKWFYSILEVYKHFKTGEKLPPINKHKLIFIDDQVGLVQEISKGDKKKKKKKQISLNDFHIISRLGTGAFGTVYRIKSKLDKKEYALKVINKNTIIEKKYFNYIMQEFEILKVLNGNPFILELHYAFQTANFLFMVVDLCINGDISNAQSISNPKLLISELILSIEYMHNKKVIYRDLKPENVLLNSEGHIKICDFNLSKMNVSENDIALSFCGSPLYLSPEMLDQKGVNFKADIYQIGLLIYEILVGRTAYKSEKLDILYDNISHNRINFDDPGLNAITQDLLKKILRRNPNERLSIKEIKSHEYFNDICWNDIYNKKCGNIIIKKKNQKKNDEDYELARNHLKCFEAKLDDNEKYSILNGKVTWKEIKKDIKRPMRNFVKQYYYVKKKDIKEDIKDDDDKDDEINTDSNNIFKLKFKDNDNI